MHSNVVVQSATMLDQAFNGAILSFLQIALIALFVAIIGALALVVASRLWHRYHHPHP